MCLRSDKSHGGCRGNYHWVSLRHNRICHTIPAGKTKKAGLVGRGGMGGMIRKEEADNRINGS